MTKIIDTGLLPVWSLKLSTGAGNFIPMTGAINTALVKTARISRNFEAASSFCQIQLGYRMSDDGETWSTPTAIGTFSAATGWLYDTASTPSSITTGQKLFVQFGLFARNGEGTNLEQGMGQLRIEVEDTAGQTVVAGPMKVWAEQDNALFHPMTGPVPIESVGAIRGSVEVESASGTVSAQPAYQVSDDGITWDAHTKFGTAQSGDGTTYGTTFAAFAPASYKQWVRFGAECVGVSGKNETCLASLRVDFRREA